MSVAPLDAEEQEEQLEQGAHRRVCLSAFAAAESKSTQCGLRCVGVCVCVWTREGGAEMWTSHDLKYIALQIRGVGGVSGERERERERDTKT